MKIAILSWFFPPSQTMGALRLGKLAKYLNEQGHELRIIAADKMPFAQTLPVEVPRECITYTPWIDVNRLSWRPRRRIVATHAAPPSAPAASKAATPPARRSRRRRLGVWYQLVVNFPDGRVGWAPYAWHTGNRLIGRWKPDVVFASGPPFTTLLVGASIARRHRVPCVLEFRDRWVEDPYKPGPRWRQWLERACQDWIIRRADALVTVSEPWAEDYRARYGKPVAVVYNGYDPADYDDTPSHGRVGSERLHIGYTGGIYPGRRDPTPLFRAVASMGEEGKAVSIEFYGTDPKAVWPLADATGVREMVTVHPRIPYAASIRAQKEADVLLLMQWDNPLEQGNVPGKVFEYLGAGRPILGLGYEDGVPATIIRRHDAGCFLNDPAAIADALRAWLAEKRNKGEVAPLPRAVAERFTRNEQYAVLEAFLAEQAGTARGAAHAGPAGSRPAARYT